MSFILFGIVGTKVDFAIPRSLYLVQLALSFAATNLSGSHSKGYTSNNIEDFQILKALRVNGKVNNAHSIREVIWSPPLCNWDKCNSDGSARGSPGHAASGGIFRGSKGEISGCFSSYIGISFALNAELVATMLAIELASQRGWHRYGWNVIPN